MKITCVVLTLLMFMNPMVQPLITYNRPELLTIVEPVSEPIVQSVVQPIIKPVHSCVICPVLTRSQGENTISLTNKSSRLPAFSVICLQ